MKQQWKNALLGMLALVLPAGFALGAGPVVDQAWLKANSCNKGVVVVDLRDPESYAAGHIPCAVNATYGKVGWRAKVNGIPGVLPPVDKLTKLIGSLGIDNSTHVVAVPFGDKAADLGAATRVFWTFTVLGHDNVSVANGGHAAYAKVKGNPLEKKNRTPSATTFNANVRKALLIGKADVAAALKSGTPTVDNRPTPQHLGIHKSGAVARFGTLPEAVSFPGEWMTDNGKGSFLPKKQIENLFAYTGAPTSGKNITFCNTGHWASLGWFVSYAIMGNKDTLMYDASMAEYGGDNSLPMVRKVNL